MPENATVEGKILQLAMAFGQGAGVMLATEQALLVALDAYRESVNARARDWNDYSLQAIEYGRVLGSLAAHHALANSRCVIDEDDVRYGLDGVTDNDRSPLGFCRLTLRERQ